MLCVVQHVGNLKGGPFNTVASNIVPSPLSVFVIKLLFKMASVAMAWSIGMRLWGLIILRCTCIAGTLG